MTSKNLAIIVKYFPTVSETFIVNQINALIDAGHRVTLYSYNKTDTTIIHNSLQKHQLVNAVNYFVKPSRSKLLRFFNAINWIFKNRKTVNWSLFINSINIFKYGKLAYTLKLFYEMQWFLLNNDFDIIHVHFGMNAKRIAYIKSLGLLLPRTKMITTFHGYDLTPNNREFYKKEYDILIDQSNAFTVNTIYLKDLLLELKHDLNNVHIIPVGLDTNVFSRTRTKSDTSFVNIVFCGKLISLKGPDMAVQILSELHNRGYQQTRLHLIGAGKMYSTIIELVNDLHLNDFVKTHGSLNQTEIKNCFEEADIFLMPGRKDPDTGRAETQGLVIQEAQSMELPVVVSDVGGMKNGLIDGETGFVVKENDLDGFVGSIEALILDRELREQMGKKGRLFVKKNYDTTVLAQKLLSVYESNNT